MVGAECRTVWAEDGWLYPAKVLSLDGERCRVRFHGYGNEEDVELRALQSPDVAVQPQRQNSQVTSPLNAPIHHMVLVVHAAVREKKTRSQKLR